MLKVSPVATENENGFCTNCTAADDGGGEGTTVGCTIFVEGEGEVRLVNHPWSGDNAEGDDDCVAADDGGGEGTTVGCTSVVESVAEGCATVEPSVFFLAAFCASFVAAVGLSLTAGADESFEAAASFLRASLASL